MRLAFVVPCLALAACSPGEPLAPAFAGRWEPMIARGRQTVAFGKGCSGPVVTIGRSGIGVSQGQLPFGATVLAIETAEVRGASADLVLRPRDPTRGLATMVNGRPLELPKFDILLTLRVQSDQIYPSNVLFRDHETGALRAAPGEAAQIVRGLSLRRCPE